MGLFESFQRVNPFSLMCPLPSPSQVAFFAGHCRLERIFNIDTDFFPTCRFTDGKTPVFIQDIQGCFSPGFLMDRSPSRLKHQRKLAPRSRARVLPNVKFRHRRYVDTIQFDPFPLSAPRSGPQLVWAVFRFIQRFYNPPASIQTPRFQDQPLRVPVQAPMARVVPAPRLFSTRSPAFPNPTGRRFPIPPHSPVATPAVRKIDRPGWAVLWPMAGSSFRKSALNPSNGAPEVPLFARRFRPEHHHKKPNRFQDSPPFFSRKIGFFLFIAADYPAGKPRSELRPPLRTLFNIVGIYFPCPSALRAFPSGHFCVPSSGF